MLERLSVRGLAIIDAVELEFGEGFAALTGETGAGKSLLVESLKLLAGQRAQSDLVRTGETRLLCEGVFSPPEGSLIKDLLDEMGIDAADELVLRREVSQNGRSRCWINDTISTAGALQRVAPHLLAIHGQHEQYGLADAAVQRQLVDDYGNHASLLQRTTAAYGDWSDAAIEVERLRSAQRSRRDRMDTITFQVAEIDGLGPRAREDDELRNRRLVLRHSARLAELSASLIERLSDGEQAVVDNLAKAEREIAEIGECGLPLAGGVDRLGEARLFVEEVVREVQGLVDQSTADPGDLDEVESRLHALEQLMLKYGSTLEQVLEHRDRLETERRELESVEDRLAEAEQGAEKALAVYDRNARKLDGARRKAGDRLAASVAEVLNRLAMGGTRLEFRWQPRPDQQSPLQRDGTAVAFDEHGVEECVLVIAANPGEELRPMARIASGGELSRIHLALRTVLRSARPEGQLTLLFDEVDSGLGGSTAAALAELLADLATVDQVLVVTHLPQVAARAGGHFRIEKKVSDGRAVTRVQVLGTDERETEIARMLAGDELTESARTHARVLLETT